MPDVSSTEMALHRQFQMTPDEHFYTTGITFNVPHPSFLDPEFEIVWWKDILVDGSHVLVQFDGIYIQDRGPFKSAHQIVEGEQKAIHNFLRVLDESTKPKFTEATVGTASASSSNAVQAGST